MSKDNPLDDYKFLTEDEKIELSQKVKKLAQEAKEDPGNDYEIYFTGEEIEELVRASCEGDKQAREALKLLGQSLESKELIALTEEYLKLTDEISELTGRIKEAKKDPTKLDSTLKKVDRAFKKFEKLQKGQIVKYSTNKISHYTVNRAFGTEIENALKMRRGNNQIKTLVKINLEEDGVSISKKITNFDREVIEAAFSLYVGGNPIMSTNMIWQIMSGNTDKRKGVSNKISNNILASMNKGMLAEVTINETSIDKDNNKIDNIMKGILCPIEIAIKEINGQLVKDAIVFTKSPIVQEYAMQRNLIEEIDLDLLKIPGSTPGQWLKLTEDVIIIRGYLMHRILAVKKSGRSSCKINYETIYKQINIKANTPGAVRNKKQKIRQITKQILDHWKNKTFIYDYEESEHKERQEVHSITLSFEVEGAQTMTEGAQTMTDRVHKR